MGRSWDARVAEYVNSPRLIHRLRAGPIISCKVTGTVGVYETRYDREGGLGSSCTCPVGSNHCKHVAALAQTYEQNPRTFTDLDQAMKKLEKKSAEELRTLIRQMVVAEPATLVALGYERFRPPEPEYEDWDR